MYASQRPSGEKRGSVSLNRVRRNGSALRTCPEPAEGTCPELAGGACPELREGSSSRSTQMSYPVVGLISMKASSCPSEDQEFGVWVYSLVVNRSSPPLPSASCQKRFTGPSLFD